jgi:hypothetical protein
LAALFLPVENNFPPPAMVVGAGPSQGYAIDSDCMSV